MAKTAIDKAVAKVEALIAEHPRSTRQLKNELEVNEDTYPALDKKIKELKNSGKIKLLDGRWALATIESCPTCQGKGWVPKRTRKAKAS